LTFSQPSNAHTSTDDNEYDASSPSSRTSASLIVSVNKNYQSVKENNPSPALLINNVIKPTSASLVSVNENKNSSSTSSCGYYRRRWNEKEKKAYV
jgi:hypothetical protein